MAVKFKIRKGDKVIVRAGRDKGKRGDVLKVLPAEHRVIVQGVNVVKRHTKPSQQGPGRDRREGSVDPHVEYCACRPQGRRCDPGRFQILG